jgi:hypothetical protein
MTRTRQKRRQAREETHIKAIGKTFQQFSARYRPWFSRTQGPKPTSVSWIETTAKKQERRDTTHTKTSPSPLFSFVPAQKIPSPEFPLLFSTVEALVSALYMQKQVSVSYGNTAKTWPAPPPKSFQTLDYLSAHNTPLTSSLSLPSNPPTNQNFDTHLPPQLSCRPPPPNSPNHTSSRHCRELIFSSFSTVFPTCTVTPVV